MILCKPLTFWPVPWGYSAESCARCDHRLGEFSTQQGSGYSSRKPRVLATNQVSARRCPQPRWSGITSSIIKVQPFISSIPAFVLWLWFIGLWSAWCWSEFNFLVVYHHASIWNQFWKKSAWYKIVLNNNHCWRTGNLVEQANNFYWLVILLSDSNLMITLVLLHTLC